MLPTTAWQAALVRLAYPHLWLPPQLDEYTSGVQRWLWPLGVLLLLALLHACYAHAHRLRPALAWALLALACAAHGADATPRSRVCAVLRIDGYSVGSRPLARLCGAAGLALLGLSLYAQACYLTHRQTACIDMLPNHHPIPCYAVTAPRHITQFTPYQCSPVYGQCYLVTTPCHAQDLGRGRAGQRTTRNRPQGSRAAGGGGQLTPLTPRGGPERRSRGRGTLLVAEQQEVATQSNKMASDFALLASWVRNNHYSKIEEAMNQADWSLPIDYQDELGNTLLHIGGQNCNKRVIKLCLRRGADINKQNLNGQGVLHFAYAYGFDDLATYCIQKGADDSLRNADGLTCYEGLSMAEVEGI